MSSPSNRFVFADVPYEDVDKSGKAVIPEKPEDDIPVGLRVCRLASCRDPGTPSSVIWTFKEGTLQIVVCSSTEYGRLLYVFIDVAIVPRFCIEVNFGRFNRFYIRLVQSKALLIIENVGVGFWFQLRNTSKYDNLDVEIMRSLDIFDDMYNISYKILPATRMVIVAPKATKEAPHNKMDVLMYSQCFANSATSDVFLQITVSRPTFKEIFAPSPGINIGEAVLRIAHVDDFNNDSDDITESDGTDPPHNEM